jgi:SAM-dependent methyltransferase
MPACVICDHSELVPEPGFGDLLRVTSDSRAWRIGGQISQCARCGMVQKPVDSAFQAEADAIYASYQLYAGAGGHEQKIFSEGVARPRSEILLSQLAARLSPDASYNLLDVGCGAGNFLQAAGKLQPRWALYGADINDHRREQILALPGVQGFFTGDIAHIDTTFDVICMSHVLEHVAAPLEFLKRLRSMLNPQGVLVVLVPNWADNYFDLLVADHCSHFTPGALRALLQRAGYGIQEESSRLLPKEIFMLAQPQHRGHNIPMTADTSHEPSLKHALHWLHSTRDWAIAVKNNRTAYGVFGTAIAATWLSQAANLAPECFVDEDLDRQGRSHLGRPVCAPEAVSDPMQVLVPLPPSIAERVAERLNTGRPSPVFFAPPLAA